MGKRIRLVALDLDGTLLNSEKLISERNLQALEELRARGILMVPVTGRPAQGIPQPVLELPELVLPPPLMTVPEPEELAVLITVGTGTYKVRPYLMLVRLVPLFRFCIRFVLAL